MGFFSAGSAKTTSRPIEWQEGKVANIFKNTERVLDQRFRAGPYKGDTYADLNDTQRDAISGIRDFANGEAGELGGVLANSAKGNIAAGTNFGSNASGLFSQYGSGNATAGILSNVGAYMQDPTLQAQIDRAVGDVQRGWQDTDVMLGQEEAMGGATGNSRSEIIRQQQLQGAKDRSAQIATDMRSGAYNRALDAASSDYFGGANLALNANQQVGMAGEMGGRAAGDALNYQQGLSGAVMSAGDILQQDEQARLDAAREQWAQTNGGFKMDALKDAYGIIGSQNWGGVSSMPGGPGIGQQLLGTGLAIGGTIAGGFAGGPMGAQMGGQLGRQAGMAFGGGYRAQG